MTRLTAALALVALQLGAVVARAQDRAADRAHDRADDRADALVSRGLELRRAGKPAEALELFRRAHEVEPSSRTLGQMGLVETSLQRWMDADQHLRGALGTPEEPWVAKNRPFLEQALARTQQHVGELAIEGPPGAEISAGGRSLGRLPLAGPLRAPEGELALTAARPGFVTRVERVVVRGGTRAAVSIALDPIEIGLRIPIPAGTDIERRRSPRVAIGAALAVAGTSAAVWGAIWIAIDARQSCGTASAGCGSVYDTGRAGWALALGGGALAVAGGVVLLESTHDRPSPALTVGAGPRSLLLSGRF